MDRKTGTEEVRKMYCIKDVFHDWYLSDWTMNSEGWFVPCWSEDKIMLLTEKQIKKIRKELKNIGVIDNYLKIMEISERKGENLL